MAIQTVRAQVNGQWYNLTLNSGNGRYEATLNAPGQTSYNQPGGYYNVIVEATNTAGTTATTDGSAMPGLKLVVKETIPPVITILSPSSGAYVTNNKQPVVFTITDEVNGSGVNPDSVMVKIDEEIADSSTVSKTSITNGYSFTYTPATALSDGNHTVEISASDYDGNKADTKSTTFTVDTVPPTLNVISPSEGIVTNNASLTVQGTTNDTTSSPVTITIMLNDVDQGAIEVLSGSFSKVLTLAEGENMIQITATDSAGKTSAVTRHVTLDTSAPEIISATITPNPADTGATMIISVEIEG